MKIGDLVQRKKGILGPKTNYLVLNKISYEQAGGFCGEGWSIMEELFYWECLREDGTVELCLATPEFERYFKVIAKGQE